MNADKRRIRIPWHFWLVGLFFIFIYAYGIYDFFMMLGHNVDYYNSKNFRGDVMVYFTDYPIFPLLLWIINIVSGITAPVLLLFRFALAIQVSLISAISILLLQFVTFTFMNRWNILGPWVSLFDIGIMLLTFGLFIYCKAMVKRGVL